MADQAGFLRNIDRVAPADELPFFVRDFKFHLWNSHDADGRPFGELLASEKARAGVDFEVRPAKYPGIRHGLGINLSGLRPMTAHWQEILADVEFVRRRFVDRHGITELSMFQLWQLSKILSALPSFIYARQSASETIPVRISGMFRAIIGIVSVTEGLLGDGADPMAKARSAAILEVAEKGGFLSQGARACAGPLHMVESFTDAVLHGTKADAAPAIEELVGDVELFFQYAEAGLLWDLANQLYRAQTRQLADRAISLFMALERRAREPAVSRPAAWVHIHCSAIGHLDLGWFTIAENAMTAEQVAGAVPLIEMFLGVEPSEEPPASQTSILTGAVSTALPWATGAEVAAVATCWSEYLTVERRLASVYLTLQENTHEGLRRLADGRSPLCHSSGPSWLTNRDFSMRLGATLGDVFASAFGVQIATLRDSDPVLCTTERAVS